MDGLRTGRTLDLEGRLSILSAMQNRNLFGIYGLIYGVLFWFWAALLTGGGHYNIPIIWANPVGFLFWPIPWALSADLTGRRSRIVFLVLFGLDYLYIIWALFLGTDTWQSQAYLSARARGDNLHLFLFPPTAVVPFVFGQYFLWSRFIRHRRPVPSLTQ